MSSEDEVEVELSEDEDYAEEREGEYAEEPAREVAQEAGRQEPGGGAADSVLEQQLLQLEERVSRHHSPPLALQRERPLGEAAAERMVKEANANPGSKSSLYGLSDLTKRERKAPARDYTTLALAKLESAPTKRPRNVKPRSDNLQLRPSTKPVPRERAKASQSQQTHANVPRALIADLLEYMRIEAEQAARRARLQPVLAQLTDWLAES